MSFENKAQLKVFRSTRIFSTFFFKLIVPLIKCPPSVIVEVIVVICDGSDDGGSGVVVYCLSRHFCTKTDIVVVTMCVHILLLLLFTSCSINIVAFVVTDVCF